MHRETMRRTKCKSNLSLVLEHIYISLSTVLSSSMPTCDVCYKDMKGATDCVLKKTCNHSMHAHCDTGEKCPACTFNEKWETYAFYGVLLLIGIILGVCLTATAAYRTLSNNTQDQIHTMVKELEVNLLTLERLAHSSVSSQLVVYNSLKHIKALVKKELSHLDIITIK